MGESIAAVVVTFNRKALLVECLGALLNQTHKLDNIYVIDQASTDGTQDLLRDRGFLAEPAIHYWRVPVNTGGSGGFHDAMQKAYQSGHSWIWIMDDDAIPEPDACEKLVPLTSFPQVVAVANRKLRKDRTTDLNHVSMLGSSPAAGDYPRLKFSSFVGLLVKREAIDRVGLPKAEFFFQYDDNEYCSRLLTCGDIAYAVDSCIVHKEAGSLRVKKQFLGISWLRLPTERYWRIYFAYRNNLWRTIHAAGRRDVWGLVRYGMSLAKEFTAVLVVDRDQRINRLEILYRAVSDALRERFDNQFGFEMQKRMLASHKRTVLEPQVGKVSNT
jgi:GT2 family glycosyltransferase